MWERAHPNGIAYDDEFGYYVGVLLRCMLLGG